MVWGAPPHRRMRSVLLCTLGLAAFGLVAGLGGHPVAIGVGVFGMTLSLTVLNGIHAAIVEVTVPPQFHGRVLALHRMVSWSALSVGFGLVAVYVSVPGTALVSPYVSIAVAMVLLVVALWSRLPRLVGDGPRGGGR
jgi:hypothetical protein